MTEPTGIVWEQWWPKLLPSHQARFTGFADGGNGYGLLDWLHQRGIDAVREEGTDNILIDTRKREDARLAPGDWLVDGLGADVYPREDSVNEEKYDREPS
jgi:hypothetical protein